MAADAFFASVEPGAPDPFADSAPPLCARWCLLHTPAAQSRGLVLHVHAFAEEMNKSRRMAALQSRALVAAGFVVLQLDLLGCGDSAGDFGDATWARWLADVRWAATRLRQHGSGLPLWLWGHRVGALLAAEAAAAVAQDDGAPCHLLLWQPVIQGRTALQQFLRLKAAAELMSGGGKGVVEGLKNELAAGRSIEVAGYRIHPELARGLEQATLAPPKPAGRVVWLELAPAAEPALLPASTMAIEKWRAAGWQVDAAALAGPAFWQTTEIEDAPALVARSTEALVA